MNDTAKCGGDADHSRVTETTVLICSRNRPGMLLDVVGSVLAGLTLPRELVVVDQTEAAHEALANLEAEAGCHFRYLHRPGRGLSAARNIGLRSATNDVVVLLDDDMFVDVSWLRLLLAARRHGGAATVVTGNVLAAPPEPGTHGYVVPPAALVTTATPDVYVGRQNGDVVPGANVAVPRDIVLALGGFDERLGAGSRFASADDNDMGFRLLEAGCEVRHVPEAVVFHRAHRPTSDLVRLRWAYGRGKGAFYVKHLTATDRHMLRRVRADLGRRARRALAHPLRSPGTTASEAVYIAGVVSGALEWSLRERRRRRQG